MMPRGTLHLMISLWQLLIAQLLGANAAMAAYPDKPIRFVVTFPAGGGNDLVARALAEGMAKDLGQQVIVDNRSGGNTVIGTEYVAARPPDGYAILFASFNFATNPSLLKSLPYDTDKAFAPVWRVNLDETAAAIGMGCGGRVRCEDRLDSFRAQGFLIVADVAL